MADGKVRKDATVMLNITGGGEAGFKRMRDVWYLKPSAVFPLDADVEQVVTKVEALFAE